MYKQLKITLIINKLLLGLKELILILYSTLLWYSYCYIYLYVCLYIHEYICICAHVHTHVTLCENVSTCLRALLLNMGVLHWECCMMYGKQSAVKYGNKLDLIWFERHKHSWPLIDHILDRILQHVDVWEWISSFIPHFTEHVIT